MRKSIKKSISLFLAAVMLIVGLPVAGLTFEARADGSSGGKYYENGYYYDIEKSNEPGGDDYAVITKYNGLIIDGKLEIPSELGGYSVKTISVAAFAYCTELISVTIPSSVTSIDADVFWECTGLTSITIPDSVTSIGSRVFDDTAWYNSQADGDIYAGKVYYKYKGTMSANTKVTIKGGTKGIADYAFEECAGLTSITIPDSVESIGRGAFWGCAGLTSVTIPDGVTSIGGYVFNDCTGLISVTIPDSVTSIGESAFSSCTGLTSVTIPDSVTNIDSFAFYCCTGLASITIPDSVTSIGDYALNGTAWYDSQPDGDVYTGKFYYKYKGTMLANTEVTIKDGTKGIADSAFNECGSLTSVTIPNSVTSIGAYAFAYCTGLTSVTISDSVTSIGNWAFRGCTGLTSVTIPNSVTSIGGCAFHDCSGLISVTIGNSVTSIGSCAFYKCTGLTSITIPDSVTDIGYEAFGYYYDENEEEMVELPDFTIYGYTDSAAETYANENGFNFVALDEEHTHTFSAWTVTTEATCTAEGVETRKCSICGAKETRRIAKKDHDISHVEEKSTCVVVGVSYDICGECGETFNYTVLPIADHTFSAWMITKEPTVFEVGEKQRSCTVCGFTEKSEIEKLRAIEKKDDKTGVSVICSDKSYDGDVEISVTEIFDGTSYHILNTEKGNFQKQLFDIATMVDGKKVQPNGSVFVKIPLPVGYNAQKTVVYYITNDGQLEKIESKVEDGYIIFETTHFSFYAIVDETPDTKNCPCKCHKTGFLKFIFKIQLLFQKLFKLNKICKCGIEHY